MLNEEKINKMTPIDVIIHASAVYSANFNKAKIKRIISKLTKEMLSYLDTELPEQWVLEDLIDIFYTDFGFKGPSLKDNNFSDYIDLETVITKRQGADIVLASLFCHIANLANFVACPVHLNGQILIRVMFNEEDYLFINAETGEYIEQDTLLLIQSANSEEFDLSGLTVTNMCFLLIYFCQLVKKTFMLTSKLNEALMISNFVLTIAPDEPYERRSRGMILASLGCPHIAVQDFNYFIEQCPNDPLAEITKAQMHAIMPVNFLLH